MAFRWRSANADAGVALIEVMFATGIMALSLTMIFGSVISLGDLGSISENRRIASSHLASLQEQVRALSYDEVLSFAPKPSDASETVVFEYTDAKGAAVPLPLGAQPPAEPLPNPLEVRLTVTHKDAKGYAHTVSGSTLVMR